MKWAVELSEHDIHYKPRKTMKGQVMADFIVGMTLKLENLEHQIYNVKPQLIQYAKEEPLWTLYVDGSSNVKGCGAGLNLVLKGLKIGFYA